MSVTKKKSEAVAARSSYDSPNLSRNSSKGSYDLSSKPYYKSGHVTLPNPKSTQRNGTLKMPRKSMKAESKQSLKLSKSVFYANSDCNDELDRVYPASCTHTPRLKDDAPLSQASSVDDLSRDISKSMSFQDLSNFSRRRKTDKYATLTSTRSQRMFRSMKLNSGSKLSINDSISDDFSDISISGSRKQLNGSTENGTETYYQSYDDFGFDEPSFNRFAAKIPTPKRDKCILSSSSYSGDVWREIGPGGGVVQIIGSDVSLHISGRSPSKISDVCTTCTITSSSKPARPRKYSAGGVRTIDRKQSSGKLFSKKLIARAASTKLQQMGPKLPDYDCPIYNGSVIDGRLVMGLEDPPDSLLLSSQTQPSKDLSPQKIGQTFVIAGPAVRLDLKDARTIRNGSIIQLPTNVVLADSNEIVSNGTESPSAQMCTFACLQSTSFYGPYKELKSCYLYGDNLQAALDPTQVVTSSAGKHSSQIHVVPVVKSKSNEFSSVSVWEGIIKKSFHVGIYGPRHAFERNTFCISISSSGFNPPFLKIKSDKAMPPLTLRLLNSHVIVTHKVQGYKTCLRTSTSSSLMLDSDLSKCVFGEEEMCTESRINRVFVLKHGTPTKSSLNSDSTSGERFIIELKGLTDRHVLKMKCKCPKLQTYELPYALAPHVAQQLAAAMEISPAAVIESKLHDIALQWIISQQDDRAHFHERKEVSAAKREVFGIRLGVAIKSSSNKNKALAVHSNFLQYSIDENIPLLSRYSPLINDVNGNKKEWWICYHKHNVGLIRTSALKCLDFDEFAGWNGTRIAAGKLVEAVTAPVLLLKCENHTVCQLLMTKLQNWKLFSACLHFGESFATSIIDKEQNKSKKEENISFFLQKFMDYCTSSGKINNFHHELLKALLYSEHFDIALELIADLALLNTATTIEGDWLQLAKLLIGKSAETEFQNFLKKDLDSETKEIWKPMHLFLCYWRERFEDNHKGALFALHQAVGNLPDTASLTHQMLTSLVILAGSVETLCQYDTTL